MSPRRPDAAGMDAAVLAYMDAIPAEQRPLFDRFHVLILAARPLADVELSYRMPTYRVGGSSLIDGVWKHGLSIYGHDLGRCAGLTDRHPELLTVKGTIRIRPRDAASLSDDELLAFMTAALDPAPA